MKENILSQVTTVEGLFNKRYYVRKKDSSNPSEQVVEERGGYIYRIGLERLQGTSGLTDKKFCSICRHSGQDVVNDVCLKCQTPQRKSKRL
jgi:hypothetical protein